MKRFHLIISIVALFICAQISSSLAQTATSPQGKVQQEKTGKLIVYYGGEESGSEVYSLSGQEDKIILSDSSQFSVSGLSIQINLKLVMDTTFNAINLNINGRAPGGPYQINTEFKDGKAKSHIRGGMDTTSEIPVHPDVLVIPNGIFYPYTFLFQKYDFQKGGTQEFFADTGPMEISLKVDDKGKEEMNYTSGSLELRKLFVNIAGMVGAYIWANDVGEIYRISIPSQGIEVYQDGFKPDTNKTDTDTLKQIYASGDVTYKSGDLEIAGTVTVPEDSFKLHPAVLFIAGSAPLDRDGKTPDFVVSFQSKDLAQILSDSGILVLRYDKRGVGKSQGNYKTATLSDLVSDAQAGVNYLKARPDVDKDRICLIGHDEGAEIAGMIAAKDTTIKAIVLMAASAKPLDRMMLENWDGFLESFGIRNDLIPYNIKAGIDTSKDFFAWVRGEKNLDTLEVKQFEKVKDRKQWYWEHFQHDPTTTVKNVRSKVLILQGGQDFAVPSENAKILNKALNQAKNPNHTMKIFPDLSHLFWKDTGTRDSTDNENVVEPLDQEFLNYLTGWLKKEL
jgi:uncharacterized protein